MLIYFTILSRSKIQLWSGREYFWQLGWLLISREASAHQAHGACVIWETCVPPGTCGETTDSGATKQGTTEFQLGKQRKANSAPPGSSSAWELVQEIANARKMNLEQPGGLRYCILLDYQTGCVLCCVIFLACTLWNRPLCIRYQQTAPDLLWSQTGSAVALVFSQLGQGRYVTFLPICYQYSQ